MKASLDLDGYLRDQGITTRPMDFPWQQMDDNERWLTKDEAIELINIWRNEAIPSKNLYYPRIKCSLIHFSSGVQNIYLNAMLDYLIEQIRESSHDPITVVATYNYDMDDILAMSDASHRVTHRFAGFMERSSYDLLLYLKDKEKELNQK